MNKEPDRNPRKALGKGLSALLPPRPQSTVPSAPHQAATTAAAAAAAPAPVATRDLPEHFEDFQSIPLAEITPGAEQPRSNFDTAKLQELADSIKANGVIQPITVFRDGAGKYRIIAGERRWRAAQMAGLTEIPALVRSAQDHERLELALIENLQREDLNPIEVATAFQRLIDEHKLSHEQVAQRTGKDRSTVTNFLRLLRATPFVRSQLAAGTITMGHARALLNLPDEVQDRYCHATVENQSSVRLVEKMVKSFLESPPPPAPAKPKIETDDDPNVRAAVAELEAALGTKVRLSMKPNGAGRLEVEFYSADDLDRIYSVIVKQ